MQNAVKGIDYLQYFRGMYGQTAAGLVGGAALDPLVPPSSIGP